MHNVSDEMTYLIDSCICTDCNDDFPVFYNVTDKPILGPEEISIYECIDSVESVEDAAMLLIAAMPNASVRQLATVTIKNLAKQAKRCCESGGLWKACLRPIINKWQEWKYIGIPADPAWD